MKKVIALLAVCGFAIALVSCGKKAEEASTTTVDTTTVVETTVDTATVVETTTVETDTIAAH